MSGRRRRRRASPVKSTAAKSVSLSALPPSLPSSFVLSLTLGVTQKQMPAAEMQVKRATRRRKTFAVWGTAPGPGSQMARRLGSRKKNNSRTPRGAEFLLRIFPFSFNHFLASRNNSCGRDFIFLGTTNSAGTFYFQLSACQ